MPVDARHKTLVFLGFMLLALGLVGCGDSGPSQADIDATVEARVEATVEARVEIEKALTLDELWSRASDHALNGDYESAITDWNEVILKLPHITPYQGSLWDDDGINSRFTKADLPVAYLFRGDSYRALGMINTGIEDHRKGIGHMLSSIEGWGRTDYNAKEASLALGDPSRIRDSKDRELWVDFGMRRWTQMQTECFSIDGRGGILGLC